MKPEKQKKKRKSKTIDSRVCRCTLILQPEKLLCKNCKFFSFFRCDSIDSRACKVGEKTKVKEIDFFGFDANYYPIIDEYNLNGYEAWIDDNEKLYVKNIILNKEFNCKYYKKKWWKR